MADKKIATDKPPMTWAEIEPLILAPFDENRVGDRWAIQHWRKESDEVRQAEQDAEVVHRFEAGKVIAAALRVHQADIRHNRAVYRERVARSQYRLASMQLREALGTHDGFFPDEEDGEHIVPELLEVRRTTKAAKVKKLQEIIDASKRLASAEGAEAGDPPSVPKGLGDGVHEFMSDLQEFLRATGDEGRELVLRICDDGDYARRLVQEEGLPRPLRFLAQIVVEATANTHLPTSQKKGGFGFGRQ